MGRRALISFFILLLAGNLVYGAGKNPAVREYREANRLFAEARYRDALPLYKKALASPPGNISPGEIHTKIADSYFRLGSFKRALAAYQRAIRYEKRSERAETQYWIGFCTFLVGRDAEAVREFLKIPEFYPENGMWVTTAYYWAGRASERLGNKSDAAWYYKKAGGAGHSEQDRFALKRARAVKK